MGGNGEVREDECLGTASFQRKNATPTVLTATECQSVLQSAEAFGVHVACYSDPSDLHSFLQEAKLNDVNATVAETQREIEEVEKANAGVRAPACAEEQPACDDDPNDAGPDSQSGTAWPDCVYSHRKWFKVNSRPPSPTRTGESVSSEVVAMNGPEAKVVKWIMDTGASNHMISKAACSGLHVYNSSKLIAIATANGLVETRERVYVPIPSLGVSVEAIVLPKNACRALCRQLEGTRFPLRLDAGGPRCSRFGRSACPADTDS